MSPELALDLSHTGIALLRRAEDGWRRVGAVSLDADTMADDIAALRSGAGPDLHAKLVIPNGQILYTSCPATGRGELADEVRVRAALAGATPYDVADLVFDWQQDGATLHIAVVARETLAEARSFAIDHGFAPVGFVAIPPRATFLREPFFGAADEGPAAGRPMRPEDEPIRIVGEWNDRPESGAAVAEAEPAPTEPGAAAPEAGFAAPTTMQDAPGDEEPPRTLPEAVPPATDPRSAVPAPDSPQTGKVAQAEPQDGVKPDPAEEAVARTRAAGQAPETEGAPPLSRGDARERPNADPAPTSTVSPAPDADEGAQGGPQDAAADGAEPSAGPSGGTGATTPDREDPVAVPPFSSIRTAGRDRGAPMVGAATADTMSTPARKLGGARRDEKPASPGRTPRQGADPAGTAPGKQVPEPSTFADDDDIPPLPSAQAGRPRGATPERGPFAIAALRKKLAARAQPPALTPEIIAAPLPRPDAAEVESVKGANARSSRGKPDGFPNFEAPPEQKPKRRIPLGLTGALVLLLAGLGLWSKLSLSGDGTAGASAVAEQSFARLAPVRGADGALTRAITFAETGTSAATIDNRGEAELAEVLKAPQPAPPPEDEALTTASLADDPFSALPEGPGRIEEPMLEIPPLPEIDADPELAAEPEPAPAMELTLSEARSAYDETGIWQRAPTATPAPQVDATEDIYIASIDPGVTLHDAVALPRAERDGGTDTPVARQPSPPPAGQVVTFEPDGSIRPTAQGVVTAEGVTLFSGRPPVAPSARPEAAQPAASDEAAQPTAEPELARTGRRPRARPQGLIEDNEKATLGGRTRAELAGLRPRARPRSAQDAAETTRQAAIEEAVRSSAREAANHQAESDRAAAAESARMQAEIENASSLAVASSRNPTARPRGFEARVAAARKQAETRPAQETRTASAAVVMPRNQRMAPALPTSASVAKAATNKNALRLRQVNLIGVFGSPSQRRALVRLPSGRLVKVKVGDRVDGGQVAAIGDNELRYVKRGRNILLEMPKG